MSETPDPAPSPLHEKLDAIMDRIALHHELSDDIRAELRGHLEDKAGAYQSGEQRLDEADIAILVEHHFGDPHTLRAMLGELHGPLPPRWPIESSSITAWCFRRKSAVLVAAVIASLSRELFSVITTMLFDRFVPWREQRVYYLASDLLEVIVLIAVLILVLHVWRPRQAGARVIVPWHARLSPAAITGVVLLALTVRWMVPVIWQQHHWWVSPNETTTILVAQMLAPIVVTFYCLVWIVWPRGSKAIQWRALLAAAVTMAVCAWLLPLLNPVGAMLEAGTRRSAIPFPVWSGGLFEWFSIVQTEIPLIALAVFGAFLLATKGMTTLMSRLRHG